MSKPTTDKKEVFSREYALSGNGTQSAIKAGISARSAHTIAYKWLRDPEVLALIRNELDARMRELGPIALDVVRDIMLDPQTPPQTRLRAAKDTLDRLGWIPPKRAEKLDLDENNLDSLSYAELCKVAAKYLN